MATQVALRRGTTAQNNAFVGVEGELTFDTQSMRLRTHDGVTVGGFEVALMSDLIAGLATKENTLGYIPEDAANKATDFSVVNHTLYPSVQAAKTYIDTAVAGAGTPPFIDTTPLVRGSVDATKLLRFEVDGFTAATTHVLTPQDADYTIAGLEITNVFAVTQVIGTSNQIILSETGSATFSPSGGGVVNIDSTLFETVSFEGSGINIGGGEAFLEGGNLTFDTPGGGSIISIDSGGPTINWSIAGTGAASFGVGSLTISAGGAIVQALTASNTVSIASSGYNLTGANAQSLIDLTGTWNTSGAPTIFKTNITNTTSGALAKFLDFQLDSVSRFNVGKFGVTTITYPALGATPTDGLQLQNTTVAAAGAQQVSPAIRLTGQGWKTTATAGSQPVDFRMYNLPVQGSTNPTANFTIDSSINGAAFSNALSLTSTGSLTVPGNMTIGGGGRLSWLTRSNITSPADGQITLLNAALSDFNRLQFGGTTSAFPSIKRNGAGLDFRLADDSNYANITTRNITQSVAALLTITAGTNQRAGNAVLVEGTVTVGNTTVTANTIVMLTRKTSGGTIGTAITYTVSAGTSFTITSDSVLDTSTFSYMLIEVV